MLAVIATLAIIYRAVLIESALEDTSLLAPLGLGTSRPSVVTRCIKAYKAWLDVNFWYKSELSTLEAIQQKLPSVETLYGIWMHANHAQFAIGR